MTRSLGGMVVVITGASAGIGCALAGALSLRGAKLALAARRVDKLEAVNASLGGGHLVVPTDVSDAAQCGALIGRVVSHFGRVDTLVCNAGYGILRPVATMTDDEHLAMFRTNVLGTTACIRAAVPAMQLQTRSAGWRGQMMIVSSALARRGLPYFGGYSGTKAAQLSLAEAMRVELREWDIAVTSVHPIGTETEFGDVAAAQSAGKRPVTRGEVRQTAEQVARAMTGAIVQPRAEVWPYRPSRWALSIATLVPAWVDRALKRRMTVEG